MGKSRNINHLWTQDEENFLINNYHNKSWEYILGVLKRHNKQQIIDKASYMKLRRERLFSFDDINMLKEIYEVCDSIDDVISHFNGKYTKKQIIKKANNLGLKNRKTLTKTLTNIDEYIRSNNTEWKTKTLIKCNRCCIFSKSKNIDIHHIYPFHKILYEVFEELGYDIKKEYQLSDAQIQIICDSFYKKQNAYGYGVCIDKNIHQLFHSVYGYKLFTTENWYKFQEDLLNGVYDKELKERNITFLFEKCGQEIV